MPSRLTEERKNKIVADYVLTKSINAAAKRNGVPWITARDVIEKNEELRTRLEQKKENQDTADIMAYMDGERDKVCKIIALGLDALADPEKLKGATPAQITTALGTLIDKWLLLKNPQIGGTAKIEIKTDDPELARWLNGN